MAVERGRHFIWCAPENKFYSVPGREAVEKNQVVKLSTFCSLLPRWVKYNLFFLEAAFKQAQSPALSTPQPSSDHRLVWTSAHEAAAAQQQRANLAKHKCQITAGEKCIGMKHTNRKQAGTGSRKSGEEPKPQNYCESTYFGKDL